MTARVVMYLTPHCPYSRRARELLDAKGVQAELVDVTGDPERRGWLERVTGSRTVPQIFVDGEPIGGSDDLHELDARGLLDALLESKPHAG